MKKIASAIAALFTAAGLNGQMLYEIDEATPVGIVAASSTDMATDVQVPGDIAVRVDLDLLRGGPGLLAFPLQDRDPLWVVRTHFEDRGNGNVVWRGRVADGPLYDSVVLTLHDGDLIGTFGELGSPRQRLYANTSGVGSVGLAVTDGESIAGKCGAVELPRFRGRFVFRVQAASRSWL